MEAKIYRRRNQANGDTFPKDSAPLPEGVLPPVGDGDVEEVDEVPGGEDLPCAVFWKVVKVSLSVGLTAKTIPIPQCPGCLQKNHQGPFPSGTVQFFVIGLLESDDEILRRI